MIDSREVADPFWRSSFPPSCLAQLRAKNPAPGTGTPSAFNGTTTTISFCYSRARQIWRLKLWRSPLESTRWVWEHAPLASKCQANGQKERNTQ
jgi:hypothetical protein